MVLVTKQNRMQRSSPSTGPDSFSSCPTSPNSWSRSSTCISSPPPCPKLLLPHQLTLEEKHHILGVLLRLENLQNMENQRDRLVREEFAKSLDDLAVTVRNKITVSSPDFATPNKYSCHICTAAIGRQKVKKERRMLSCWDCGQLVCNSCGVKERHTGPFDNRINSKAVRLCKPCMYRREMTLKSGEWFYGAAGAQEVRNVHKSVIESLGIPKCSSHDEKDDNDDVTNWKQKAQKRFGQSSLTTLKAMKRRWQRLAKFNRHRASLNDSKGSENSSDDEERSRFSEEIQEQYRAFRDSKAAFKLSKKGYCEESSTSSTCSKQWSRESSPDRSCRLRSSALSSVSMTSVKGTTHVDLLDVRRKMHRSAESLPVEIQRGKGGALNTRGRKRNHVSMELAKRMSQKGSVLQKWRSTAGSCSNILFNTVNNDLNRNTQPTSTKSSRSMKYNCNYL
ncbi:hypothetical protein ACHWQZ_G016695 [Mnemiopsis leidyi]